MGSRGARHPLPPWLLSHPEHEYRGLSNRAGTASALPRRLATPKSPLCWASPGYSVHCPAGLLAWLRLVPLGALARDLAF